MVSRVFGTLGASGLEKALASRPVPSTTATRFPPRALVIMKMGMNIRPAMITGKKRVMNMNIFFRTAARYSRFSTARIFLTASPPAPRRRLSR